MDAFSRVLSRMPWLPVLGNHEFYEDGPNAERYVDMVEGGVAQEVRRLEMSHPSNDGSALNAALSIGQSLGPATGVGSGGVGGGPFFVNLRLPLCKLRGVDAVPAVGGRVAKGRLGDWQGLCRF